MSIKPRSSLRLFLVAAALYGPLFPVQGQSSEATESSARPVTVADSIEMTLVGDPSFEYVDREPVQFSPDGNEFVVVTRRGSLKDNTNQYSILLFHTAEAFRSPHPEILVHFTSSSNRPGIANIRWVNNHTIAFLGASDDLAQKVFLYDIDTRRLEEHASLPTDIVCFATTRDLATSVFLARPAIRSFFSPDTLNHGLLISHQFLNDLLIGHPSDNDITYPAELLVLRQGVGVVKVDLAQDNPRPEVGLFLSPNGKYAVVFAFVDKVPAAWSEYKDVVRPGSLVMRYLLVNTQTATARPLINAPASARGFSSQVVWAADSKTVMVAGTYLPLDVEDKSERQVRSNSTFAAEIDPATGHFTKIASGDYDLLGSDTSAMSVSLKSLTGPHTGQNDVLTYDKVNGSWRKSKKADAHQTVQVFEAQSMNDPPRLMVLNPGTGEKTLLLDLNPQFRSLKFGYVEEITWKASDGHDEKGGLYFPLDYVPGKRYPLVVQTHGWDSTKFWIDGVSTAGYAAQALVGKGFAVVQSPNLKGDWGTTREGPRAVSMYEGLVDYLDRRGIIDRKRVALQAWSRSGYWVRYALTFSKFRFAAAAIVDGMDASYGQYIVEQNLENGHGADEYAQMHGAAPFGQGLQMWLTNATGFNLDKIQTPVRLVALGPYSLITNNWEWFTGLQHLGSPVEMVWLRDALHMPVKPLERVTAQQGTVDWFCFWLNDEEDADPTKADQYMRWREMRDRQTFTEHRTP